MYLTLLRTTLTVYSRWTGRSVSLPENHLLARENKREGGHEIFSSNGPKARDSFFFSVLIIVIFTLRIFRTFPDVLFRVYL